MMFATKKCSFYLFFWLPSNRLFFIRCREPALAIANNCTNRWWNGCLKTMPNLRSKKHALQMGNWCTFDRGNLTGTGAVVEQYTVYCMLCMQCLKTKLPGIQYMSSILHIFIIHDLLLQYSGAKYSSRNSSRYGLLSEVDFSNLWQCWSVPCPNGLVEG